MSKEPFIKKVVVIDNCLYELKEIKSVKEYNDLKAISEKAFYDKLKLDSEIKEKELREKEAREKSQKLNAYYDKSRLFALLNALFTAIEYGFIEEEENLFEECESAFRDLENENVRNILGNYDLVRKYWNRYYGELDL